MPSSEKFRTVGDFFNFGGIKRTSPHCDCFISGTKVRVSSTGLVFQGAAVDAQSLVDEVKAFGKRFSGDER